MNQMAEFDVVLQEVANSHGNFSLDENVDLESRRSCLTGITVGSCESQAPESSNALLHQLFEDSTSVFGKDANCEELPVITSRLNFLIAYLHFFILFK